MKSDEARGMAAAPAASCQSTASKVDAPASGLQSPAGSIGYRFAVQPRMHGAAVGPLTLCGQHVKLVDRALSKRRDSIVCATQACAFRPGIYRPARLARPHVGHGRSKRTGYRQKSICRGHELFCRRLNLADTSRSAECGKQANTVR